MMTVVLKCFFVFCFFLFFFFFGGGQMLSISCAFFYDILLCSNGVKFSSGLERICNKILFCETCKTWCDLIIFMHVVLFAEVCGVRASSLE